MLTHIIYKITNKKNGKYYIGQTEYSLEHRWKRHKSSARNGSKFRFHSAIRKYGEDCWDLSIIETYHTEDKDFVNKKETHFITLFESDTKKGYNATASGTGGWMLPRCSPEVQEAWRMDIISRTTGDNNPNYTGLTNDDLVEIGIEFAMKYGFIGGKTRLVRFAKDELNVKFPKHFTNYRFGGSYTTFYKILEEKTGLKYNRWYRDEKQRKVLAEKASINSTKMWETRRQQNASN